MKSALLSWLVTALALLVGAALLDGVTVTGPLAALLAAVILGLVNAVIKPVLFILTLPITLVTLGLFYLILNVAMVGLAAWLSPGFRIEGFWSAVGLAIVIAIINAVIGGMLRDESDFRQG